MKLIIAAAVLSVFLSSGRALSAEANPKGDAERGEELYRALCWTCHGRYGRGDGPAAQYLAAPPRDFTDPSVLRGKSDRTLFNLLSGKDRPAAPHAPMTIGEILKEQAIWDAIAYVRTLAISGKRVSMQAGRDIYETFCVSCHGTHGDGKGAAAKNLVGVKPRDFTRKDFVIEGREEEIFQTIFAGAAKAYHGSPYMPEWKKTLTRKQILDVVEYLKTFKR